MKVYNKWISLFMAIIYLVVGIVLVFTNWFLRENNKYINFTLGIFIIIYGIFRGFRSYRSFYDDNKE
jgi:uncharacterized membrane protein HdeD (DUF308 family)